ncbi:hypothetical protein EB231_32325 [Mesorhizobium sp. NZP2298]|nr:hypothetical protein EB231_32190 [Mesorhizobium sp. NZP2298]QKC98795.1 hypothetical protein EB231_32325 [Mesorhizobium sp. NZP2298]
MFGGAARETGGFGWAAEGVAGGFEGGRYPMIRFRVAAVDARLSPAELSPAKSRQLLSADE